MKIYYLFVLFFNIIQIKSYIYEKIKSFENKTINLNSSNRFKIYELEHVDESGSYIGNIYIFF